MSDDIYADTVATLGDRLTAAREAAGLSVDQLAGELGVRPETQLGWEVDQAEPGAPLLNQIAGRLEVSPQWLLTGQGEAPQELSQNAAVLDELRTLRNLLSEATARIDRLQEALSNG
ncbi:helix-turn-helix transcriptional regulator [Paracoccus sp. (in: a-proteobacteria)]|uniref:helix-turn-helix domain-containing protein n=1 Tax=Paracoccus sp. TaxID=267 RepID=UPI00391BC94F